MSTRNQSQNQMCDVSLYSHAVRWEICAHNPISSGIAVGAGGKRGPSVGVRISAKRLRSPLVLSPDQVKQGLSELEFRDQLLVFLDGALGVQRGELGSLAVDGLRFREPVLHGPALFLLAPWRASQGDEASAKPLPMLESLEGKVIATAAQMQTGLRAQSATVLFEFSPGRRCFAELA